MAKLQQVTSATSAATAKRASNPQLSYRYNGNQPGTHERIISMTMNGSGVRDIGRVLEISPTTVGAHCNRSNSGVYKFLKT